MRTFILLSFLFSATNLHAQTAPPTGDLRTDQPSAPAEIINGWEKTFLPGSPYLTGVSFGTADTGWISSKDTLYRTIDGGKTWTPIGPFFVDSVRGGYGWVQFVNSSDGWSFNGCGCESFIKQTTDGGVSWSSLGNPQISSFDIGFKMMGRNSGFGFGDHEISRTVDGNHFAISQVEGWTFKDIAFLTPKVYIAVGGIYTKTEPFKHERPSLAITKDGGETWSNVEPWVGKEGFASIARLSNTSALVAGSGGVYKTIDQGTTWQRIRPKPDTVIHFGYIKFADSLHGFAGNYWGTVFYTSDGGLSWENRSLPFQNGYINAAAMSSPTSAILVGDNGMVFRWVGPQGSVKSAPKTFSSSVNPVPSTGSVRINYTLPIPASVVLSVSDIRGIKIFELTSAFQDSGLHSQVISRLKPGDYFYRITAGDLSSSGKFTIIK